MSTITCIISLFISVKTVRFTACIYAAHIQPFVYNNLLPSKFLNIKWNWESWYRILPQNKDLASISIMIDGWRKLFSTWWNYPSFMSITALYILQQFCCPRLFWQCPFSRQQNFAQVFITSSLFFNSLIPKIAHMIPFQ